MKFIELRNYPAGSMVFIRVDQISALVQENSYTRVYICGDSSTLNVMDSIGIILDEIERANRKHEGYAPLDNSGSIPDTAFAGGEIKKIKDGTKIVPFEPIKGKYNGDITITINGNCEENMADHIGAMIIQRLKGLQS